MFTARYGLNVCVCVYIYIIHANFNLSSGYYHHTVDLELRTIRVNER